MFRIIIGVPDKSINKDLLYQDLATFLQKLMDYKESVSVSEPLVYKRPAELEVLLVIIETLFYALKELEKSTNSSITDANVLANLRQHFAKGSSYPPLDNLRKAVENLKSLRRGIVLVNFEFLTKLDLKYNYTRENALEINYESHVFKKESFRKALSDEVKISKKDYLVEQQKKKMKAEQEKRARAEEDRKWKEFREKEAKKEEETNQRRLTKEELIKDFNKLMSEINAIPGGASWDEKKVFTLNFLLIIERIFTLLITKFNTSIQELSELAKSAGHDENEYLKNLLLSVSPEQRKLQNPVTIRLLIHKYSLMNVYSEQSSLFEDESFREVFVHERKVPESLKNEVLGDKSMPKYDFPEPEISVQVKEKDAAPMIDARDLTKIHKKIDSYISNRSNSFLNLFRNSRLTLMKKTLAQALKETITSDTTIEQLGRYLERAENLNSSIEDLYEKGNENFKTFELSNVAVLKIYFKETLKSTSTIFTDPLCKAISREYDINSKKEVGDEVGKVYRGPFKSGFRVLLSDIDQFVIKSPANYFKKT